LGDLSAVDGEGAFGAGDGTEAAAGGAGLLGPQGGGLLFQEGSESAFEDTGGGGAGDLFHGVYIDVGARPVGAEGATGDNFAPLRREVLNLLEALRGRITLRHTSSCLVLR